MSYVLYVNSQILYVLIIIFICHEIRKTDIVSCVFLKNLPAFLNIVSEVILSFLNKLEII